MKRVFVILFSLIYIFVFDVSTLLSQINDTTPPNFLTFDFNPKTVDVSQSFATVQFTATALDDLSGIRNGNFFFRLSNGEPRSGSLQVQSVDINGVATLVGTLGLIC